MGIKSKMKLLSLRLGDWIAILFSLLAAAATLLFALYGIGESEYVRITAGETDWVYPLYTDEGVDEARIITPLEEEGTCRIVVDEKGVWVQDSDCPQQICVSMGSIQRAGEWIACLPHKVFIEITGEPPADTGLDAHSY